MNEALTFDDVLMVPQYSEVESRNEIDVTGPNSPIIPANMKSIAGGAFAHYCEENKLPFILNRYAPIGDIINFVLKTHYGSNVLKAFSIGVLIPNSEEWKKLSELFDSDLFQTMIFEMKIGICIDVAHGHHKLVKETVNYLRNDFGFKGIIIAGNVCTSTAFVDLVNWGANIIKVGVGNGSVCTTRLVTGHGLPQWQAIVDCVTERNFRAFRGLHFGKNVFEEKFHGVKIIADGGVRTPGDIAKAIGAGADYVMTGSMFAGTDMCEDKINYSGMASLENKTRNNLGATFIEGVTKSAFKAGPGSTGKVYNQINDGLRSAISYSGFRTLQDFRGNAEFIRVSANTLRENGVHFT